MKSGGTGRSDTPGLKPTDVVAFTAGSKPALHSPQFFRGLREKELFANAGIRSDSRAAWSAVPWVHCRTEAKPDLICRSQHRHNTGFARAGILFGSSRSTTRRKPPRIFRVTSSGIQRRRPRGACERRNGRRYEGVLGGLGDAGLRREIAGRLFGVFFVEDAIEGVSGEEVKVR